MHLEAIDRLLGNNKKALVINTILIASALIWYIYAFNFLIKTIEVSEFYGQVLPIIALHFLVLFVAVVVGESLSHKIKNRLTFLLLWMLTGIFLSMLPLIAGSTNTGGMTYLATVLFSVITGINFGFGIPLCLGYFAETTEAGNRGKSGGIIFLLTGVGTFLISGIGVNSFLSVSFILAIWRAVGFIALLFVARSVKPLSAKPKISYRKIVTNRTFILYFIPWLMFQLVNSLSFPINEQLINPKMVIDSSNVEFILGGFSAVIFGFFADSKGRKRLAVAGFALLGLGYAVLGLTQQNIYGWWFYTFIDGITWGSFMMLFVFALWGDIAEGRRSERIYAIAIIPYLLSSLIRLSLGTYLASLVKEIGSASIFSLFSFFLFIAVLPLVIAPETLSEQTIKNNDLKSYVDKAQKQALKRKNHPKSKEENKDNSESGEQSDENKKAQELAEKYY